MEGSILVAEKEALASQLAEYSAVVQEEERVIDELRVALAAEERRREDAESALVVHGGVTGIEDGLEGP